MSPEELHERTEQFHAALVELVQEHAPLIWVDCFGKEEVPYARKVVMVTEWLHDDGAAMSWSGCNHSGEQLPEWDVKGLLQDVLDTHQAQAVARAVLAGMGENS